VSRHPREIVFGVIAIALVIGYGLLGSRAAPLVVSAGTPTPTPTKPVSAVPAPQIPGTIAFALRGDVYLLRDGKYVGVTRGRSNRICRGTGARCCSRGRRRSTEGARSTARSRRRSSATRTS
jgi:hypothetical protein